MRRFRHLIMTICAAGVRGNAALDGRDAGWPIARGRHKAGWSAVGRRIVLTAHGVTLTRCDDLARRPSRTVPNPTRSDYYNVGGH